MAATIQGSPVAIDLFAGAGGLSEGLLAAGINVAVAVEKHPHPALTYAFNHPRTAVLCGQIKNLSLDRVAAVLRETTGTDKVDLVAGGPPCQGYSSAGKRRKNDRRNKLYEEFLRFVDFFKPRMVLFENVPGFVDHDGGTAIKAITKRLWRAGYTIKGFETGKHELPSEFPILDACHFGVPQRRKRFLLVAWLQSEVSKVFEWPLSTHGAEEKEDGKKLITVGEALGDLSFLTAGNEANKYMLEATSDYQRARRNKCSLLFNHLATKHRRSTVNMYRKLNPGDTIRSIPEEHRTGKQTMRRLDPDSISKAILALPDDLVHYCRLRIPTVREMARLQSFDDDYVFLGKRTTSDLNRRIDVPQYTQVGNAVPPLLAKALGLAILKALGRRAGDLRDLKSRRARHQWLHGSSGFMGYTLDEMAQGDLSLFDIAYRRKQLPIAAEDDEAVSTLKPIVKWTSRPQRKSSPVFASSR